MKSSLPLFQTFLVFTFLNILNPTAIARTAADDALEFHALLTPLLDSRLQQPEANSLVHMIPDANLLRAFSASNREELLGYAKNSSFKGLVEGTRALRVPSAPRAQDLLARHPITLVVIPGLFNELEPVHPFDDLLSVNSVDFQATLQSLKGASDFSYDLKSNADIQHPLEELIRVGTVLDNTGHRLARLVVMQTPYMSLESFNDISEQAANYSRRLEKYLAITGPQNLVLVGYSRGTPIALEMLHQARLKNSSWLRSTSAMVSLSGVTFGSALADETQRAGSANQQLVAATKAMVDSIDPNSITSTLEAWTLFGWRVAQISLTTSSSSDSSGDSPWDLARHIWNQLDLAHPINDFSGNIARLQKAVRASLVAVDQLTTRSRFEWWVKHEIPKNLRYYSLAGILPNPALGGIDQVAYASQIGFAGNSPEELEALKARIDYETLSGLGENDGQVSVAESMISPLMIAGLNPANRGAKSLFLGILGTHHWGLVYSSLNPSSTLNPYPRGSLLGALAAKIAWDLDRH